MRFGIGGGQTLFFFAKGAEKCDREDCGDDHCDHIGGGRGPKDSFDTECKRQQKNERDEADDVADHRRDDGAHRSSGCLEENRRHFNQTGERNQHQEDAECFAREFPVVSGIDVVVVGSAEDAHDRLRRDLEKKGETCADNNGTQKDILVQLAHTVVLARAEVVSYNRLATEYDTHYEIDNHGKYFTFDGDNGNGNVLAVFGKSSVLFEHDVAYEGNDHDGHLRNKRRKTQLERTGKFFEMRDKTAKRQLERFGAEEIDKRDDERHRLSDNGSPSGARHAPFASEDEYGIENDIDDRARKHRRHRPAGTSVGTDHGVHHIHQHEQREERENDIEIFHRQTDTVFRCAEDRKQRTFERIEHGHQRAGAKQCDHQAGADRFVRVFRFVTALADIQVGGAPVAETPGKCLGNNKDGENYAGCRVSEHA